MGTWLEDLKGEKPTLAKAYAVTGNQPIWALKNMIKALEMCPFLNTPADEKRLEAAKYILRNQKRENVRAR